MLINIVSGFILGYLIPLLLFSKSIIGFIVSRGIRNYNNPFLWLFFKPFPTVILKIMTMIVFSSLILILIRDTDWLIPVVIVFILFIGFLSVLFIALSFTGIDDPRNPFEYYFLSNFNINKDSGLERNSIVISTLMSVALRDDNPRYMETISKIDKEATKLSNRSIFERYIFPESSSIYDDGKKYINYGSDYKIITDYHELLNGLTSIENDLLLIDIDKISHERITMTVLSIIELMYHTVGFKDDIDKEYGDGTSVEVLRSAIAITGKLIARMQKLSYNEINNK